MKKVLLISSIILSLFFLISCSNTEDATVSVKLTDSSAEKAGANLSISMEITDISLGYQEGNDTVWVNLLEQPAKVTMNLQAGAEVTVEGCDSVHINANLPYSFLRIKMLPPSIQMDTLSISVMGEDTLDVSFQFEHSLTIENGHVDFYINLNSNMWLPINFMGSIDADSMKAAMSCQIGG